MRRAANKNHAGLEFQRALGLRGNDATPTARWGSIEIKLCTTRCTGAGWAAAGLLRGWKREMRLLK